MIRRNAVTLVGGDEVGFESTIDWIILQGSSLWETDHVPHHLFTRKPEVIHVSRSLCCPSGHEERVTYHFLDGVGDEDEGDEAGEALLCETGHVFYDVAGV